MGVRRSIGIDSNRIAVSREAVPRVGRKKRETSERVSLFASMGMSPQMGVRRNKDIDSNRIAVSREAVLS
ncbi:hypothetical protein [Paenibacillus urinalis]|uniref:hypothetical protein n=1 Tax=Paenibacillus urinalis TaxID=521520 RepID=UPI00196209C9